MPTFKQRAILKCFQEGMSQKAAFNKLNSLYGDKFVSPTYLKNMYKKHLKEGLPPNSMPIIAPSNDYTLSATDNEVETRLIFDSNSQSFTDLLPRRSPPRPTYLLVINPTYDALSFL